MVRRGPAPVLFERLRLGTINLINCIKNLAAIDTATADLTSAAASDARANGIMKGPQITGTTII